MSLGSHCTASLILELLNTQTGYKVRLPIGRREDAACPGAELLCYRACTVLRSFSGQEPLRAKAASAVVTSGCLDTS